jgi:hypothetical protein
MPRGGLRLSALGVRKRLLIAESDLNRARLVEDMAAFAGGVRSVTDRARTIGSLASAAAVLVASVAALRSSRAVVAGARPSRFQAILKRAGILSTVWLAFRSQGRRESDRAPSWRDLRP